MRCEKPADAVVSVTVEPITPAGHGISHGIISRSARSSFCVACLHLWHDEAAAELREQARAAGIGKCRGIAMLDDAAEMDDIRDSVRDMRARYESGQGTLRDAMCRLSLPMAERLLKELG